jgi:hypothetical protein
MRIKDELLGPYEIECGSDCYTLIKTHQGKKGPRQSIVGYFSDLAYAIKKIAALLTDAGREENLNLGQYIDRYENIKNQLLKNVSVK